ncbi:MAG: hypothetical protein LBG19_03245 [Prevotellaceae bacterium]|nr:hypothetical protein [Prevotellaceae bacterium]
MTSTRKNLAQKQGGRIADRNFDSVDSLLIGCSEESKKVLKELMYSTFKMGVDYCNNLHQGETITLSEASRISGISEYHIKQAILHNELNGKKLGNSRNSTIRLNLHEFNLWRNFKNE